MSYAYFAPDERENPYWNAFSQAPGTHPQAQAFGTPSQETAPFAFDEPRGAVWPRASGLDAPPPAVPPATSWSPHTQKWLYLDPSGMVQGPFAATAMQAWYEQQYLYSDLLLRPEEDPEFRPLHVLVQELGYPGQPFLVPPPRRHVAQTPGPAPGAMPGVASHRSSPHMPAPHSPRVPGAGMMPSTATETAPSSSSPTTAPHAAGTTLTPSNFSADDIAAAVRVMTQLQSLMASGASESQTLSMMQSVMASSLPHANAAALQDMLQAMQSQAAHDAAHAVQVQKDMDEQAQQEPITDTHATSPDTHGDTQVTEHASVVPATSSTEAVPPADAQAEPAAPPADATPAVDEEVKPTKAPAPPADVAAATPASADEAAAPATTTEPAETVAAPTTPAKTPAAAKSAPWASSASKASNATPNMREILEAEQRDRAAQDAKDRAANSAMLARAMAQIQVSSATTSSSPAAPTRSTTAAWNVPKTTPAKSLSQIQQEESARAAHEIAAQASKPSAYSNSVLRSSTHTEAPAPTPSQDHGWVKVAAGGKTVPSSSSKAAAPTKPTGLPAKPAGLPKPAPLPSRPPALATPSATPSTAATAKVVPTVDEDGWVTMKPKHQVRRDALSQMNDGIPRPTGTAAGIPTATRRAATTAGAPSSTPQPPSSEFLQYCRDQLRGLRANVDDFVEMLLSFPLNPSPDVADIIAEAVYANSSTLDGRRFAADFISRRKADAYRAVTL